MKHSWKEVSDQLDIKYEWKLNDKWNSIVVQAKKELSKTKEGSQERFIAEHYWGYIKINQKKSYEFRVEHPEWKMYSLIMMLDRLRWLSNMLDEMFDK